MGDWHGKQENLTNGRSTNRHGSGGGGDGLRISSGVGTTQGRSLVSSTGDAFNRTGFSRFINGPAGRVFRVAAGVAFLLGVLVSRR